MVVYLITNLTNKKRYVGQTIQPIKRRWSMHLYIKSRCLALNSAIRKYGQENFDIKVLAHCNTIEEMNHREQYYIKLFNTLAPNGYNLTSGGERPFFSIEARKKMANARIGMIPWNKGLTKEDSRVAILVNRMMDGKNNKFLGSSPRKGTVTSIEALVNLRNSYKERFIKVKCNETGEIFESIKAAAIAFNIRGGNISKNIRGQTPTVGGYTFCRILE